MRRTARFGRDVVIIYAGYKWTQRRVRGRSAAAKAAAYTAQHERAARRIYHLAVDLKGLNIKTGQFIGARADIVPPPFVRWLGRLHDRVPPRPVALIRKTLEAELGRPIDQLFARFDDEPLAAASLAQVHRARLHDGREVAVKVQYPEVEELVHLDLRNTRTVVHLVARREPNFDYRAVLGELERELPHELNFVREAEMIRRVAANLRAVPDVALPDVIDDLLSRRVLVTTFIDGAQVLDLPALERMGVDRVHVARTLAGAYGRQILTDGLFQADPHPGNIIVRPDGVVVLIDFGLTKELPPAVRMGFARLVVASARHDPAAVLTAFEELGIRTRHDEHASILTLVRLLFDERPILGDPSIVQRSEEALSYNPINAVPGDLILLGRVIGLLRGVAASLRAPFTPMEMLLPYAEAVLKGRPMPDRIAPPEAEPRADPPARGDPAAAGD